MLSMFHCTPPSHQGRPQQQTCQSLTLICVKDAPIMVNYHQLLQKFCIRRQCFSSLIIWRQWRQVCVMEGLHLAQILLSVGNNIVMFMAIDIDSSLWLVGQKEESMSMKPSSGSPDSDGVLEHVLHFGCVFTVGEGPLHGCGVCRKKCKSSRYECRFILSYQKIIVGGN